MQSTEYPDLRFVEPRWWNTGRDGYSVQYVVVHYTAGSERSTSAEDGAAYDAVRDQQVSTHYFVDSDSVVQCILTKDRASAAFFYGNRMGIHYELCGTQQSREEWLDPASDATITNAARQIARDCKKYGLPVRWLSPTEMKNGLRGIGGHDTVTLAYGLGDHMDPGAAFPRDILLQRVNQFMGGSPVDAPTKRKKRNMIEYVWYLKTPLTYAVERPYHPDPAMRWEEGDAVDAVGWLVAGGIQASTELSTAGWNERKNRYVAGGIGAHDWAHADA